MTRISTVLLVAAVLLFPAIRLYADVPVDPSQYSSSRTKSLLTNPSGGITAVNFSNGIVNYSINWSITQNGDGTYHYLYSLSNTLGLGPSQTQFFLQLAPGTAITDLNNLQVNGSAIGTLAGVTANTYTFSSDFGVLFNSTASVLISNASFDVNALPIWGDFANGSLLTTNGSYVRNTGLGTAPNGAPAYTNFLASPGDVVAVATPEPSTMLMLTSCLCVALFAKKRYSTVKE